MTQQRHSRAKRNSFIINLIQTPSGFSLIEGIDLLNKTQNFTSHPHPHLSLTSNQQYTPVSKQLKSVFKKVNIIFPFKFIPTSQQVSEHKAVTAESVIDSQSVNKSQQKEIAKWLGQKYRISSEQAFQRADFLTFVELYKQNRNFAASLYEKDYLPKREYLSANILRKFLCCEAFWIMKLHHFLNSIGVINHQSSPLQNRLSNDSHIFKGIFSTKKELICSELTGSQTDPDEKGDQKKLLSKLTAELRPYCDYCRIHCGIVWFQHNRSLDPRQISSIMKNVNSKNPPLSQKQYEYILCIRCYCESHFPLLLTHHDFKKVTVNDKIEPRRKKNKKKRKAKSRRYGDGQMQEEGKQVIEEDNTPHPEEEELARKQETVKVISRLINGVNNYKWRLDETSYLLQLVQKYQEDWLKIHEMLKKKGFCKSIQTEDIITYFLRLPTHGVTQLKEQYSQDQFIQSNLPDHSDTTINRLAESKLNDSLILTSKVSEETIEKAKQKMMNGHVPWKQRLIKVLNLSMQKSRQRVGYLEECEEICRRWILNVHK